MNDGHSWEKQSEMDRERERGTKDCGEKKRGRETVKEEHGLGNSGKEVRQETLSGLVM